MADITQFCSASLCRDEDIKQISYYNSGSYVCQLCAKTCRQSVKFEQTEHFFFKFTCNCQFLEGGCSHAFQEEVTESMKQECINLNLAKIEMITDKEIARNMSTE